jgi:hypothetical protein
MQYANAVSVTINEIVILQHLHTTIINDQQNSVVVAEIVMHYDALKNTHAFLAELIAKHDQALRDQKEANKKLS